MLETQKTNLCYITTYIIMDEADRMLDMGFNMEGCFDLSRLTITYVRHLPCAYQVLVLLKYAMVQFTYALLLLCKISSAVRKSPGNFLSCKNA
jgi:hypothetical protein